jgi:hypothetical protein
MKIKQILKFFLLVSLITSCDYTEIIDEHALIKGDLLLKDGLGMEELNFYNLTSVNFGDGIIRRKSAKDENTAKSAIIKNKNNENLFRFGYKVIEKGKLKIFNVDDYVDFEKGLFSSRKPTETSLILDRYLNGEWEYLFNNQEMIWTQGNKKIVFGIN